MKAIMFPGQGAQYPGMGAEVLQRFPAYVEQASDILGYDIKSLCLTGDHGRLSLTQYTQPALFLVNALTYMSQRDDGESPADFLLGHSLGEYNALFAAGAFDFASGLRLVKKRGELMAQAREGGMAAVLGLRSDRIKSLLTDSGLHDVDLANYNAPQQTVISGAKQALDACEAIFTQAGARVVMLDVSAAFHSRFMRPAQARYREFLRGIAFNPTSATVIANVTARPLADAGIAENLAAQISQPVLWVDSIRYLMGRGVTTYREVGGTALGKLVTQIRAGETPLRVATKPAPDQAQAQAQRVGGGSAAPAGDAAPGLGSASFCRAYGVKYAYVASALPGRACSADWVSKLARAKILGFLTTDGLSLQEIKNRVERLRASLHDGDPFGVAVFCEFDDPASDWAKIALLLENKVDRLQALGYVAPTPALVWYRIQGLAAEKKHGSGTGRRLLVQVGTPAHADAFMRPPAENILRQLRERGRICEDDMALARSIPVCSEIYIDGLVAASAAPENVSDVLIRRLREPSAALDGVHKLTREVAVGVASGIGDPHTAARAFAAGADFIVTDAINQCTAEADLDPACKRLLQSADVGHSEYAPTAGGFKFGLKSPFLTKSTPYAAKANALADIYRRYDSLDQLGETEKTYLCENIFQKNLDQVWGDLVRCYNEANKRDDVQRAEFSPKYKLLLIIHWYLERARAQATAQQQDQVADLALYNTAALGLFNRWAGGSEFEDWSHRHPDDIAERIMAGAAVIAGRR